MGQILRIIATTAPIIEQQHDYNRIDHEHDCDHHEDDHLGADNGDQDKDLPDLANWPPELSLTVLANLNATDLCLAACVWKSLARDEVLWHSLCCSQWGYVSIYFKSKKNLANFTYHRLYLQLDEGSVTFNADANMGMTYFFTHQLVDDIPLEVAKFIFHSKPLDKRQTRLYLNDHPEVLDHLVNLNNFENQFLPNALRNFFSLLEAPNEHDRYLHLMVEKFSHRFCKCNPRLGLTPDMIYVLCFSLIMLSVDLASPHVKNKMSKREFIRNVRNAIHRMDDELYGHLYDDIYLRGHIADTPDGRKKSNKGSQ